MMPVCVVKASQAPQSVESLSVPVANFTTCNNSRTGQALEPLHSFRPLKVINLPSRAS